MRTNYSAHKPTKRRVAWDLNSWPSWPDGHASSIRTWFYSLSQRGNHVVSTFKGISPGYDEVSRITQIIKQVR